jgi:hypothetical protein
MVLAGNLFVVFAESDEGLRNHVMRLVDMKRHVIVW